MATLTEQLDALIAEHGLASIGLVRLAHSDGYGAFWSVNAQAEMPGGNREIGSSGHDDETPEAALSHAISELNAKRIRPANVPMLAAA